VHLHLDQVEGLELAVEADRKADDFQLAPVLGGLDQHRHRYSPSCAASQL
jgi:hypothetical protein